MSLSGKDVAEIARMLDASRFAALDLEVGDFRLRIRRAGAASASSWSDDAAEPAEVAPQAAAPAIPAAPAGAPGPGEVDVPAPLLGVFYHSPRPGDPPFVQIGQQVDEETVFGIIEVMKLMNGVRAGVKGTVIALLAPNAEAVEAGQPLLRVATR